MLEVTSITGIAEHQKASICDSLGCGNKDEGFLPLPSDTGVTRQVDSCELPWR